TFIYRVNGDRVVPADDAAVLRSPRHELLILQACHPRFFASHRFLVYARLVHVDPRGGQPYDLTASGVTTQSSGRYRTGSPAASSPSSPATHTCSFAAPARPIMFDLRPLIVSHDTPSPNTEL